MPLYPEQVDLNVTEIMEQEMFKRDMQGNIEGQEQGEQAKIIMEIIKNMTEAAQKAGKGNDAEREKMDYYMKLAGDDEDEDKPSPQINITEILRERLEKERQELFREGLSYAVELAYFIWVLLSFALCSGMFVENPV